LRERLAGEGLTGTLRLDFHQLPAPGALFIHRTHPLVSVLADYLLEKALDEEPSHFDQADWVARAGAIFTGAVTVRTTVLLLRLRHQLTVTRRNQSRLSMCEETLALVLEGSESPATLDEFRARLLLDAQPERNMPAPLRDRHIQQALDSLPRWQPLLEELAHARARTLLEDHRRVREASAATGTYQVSPSLPVDVMGLYVLIPAA
jgi:hypothetical protein